MFPVFLGMLLYGLVHSLLAGQQMKVAVRKRIGERAYQGLYRITYNLFAVLSILPILILIAKRPGENVWSFHERWEAPLLIIRVIALIGFLVSSLHIDILRFLGIRQLFAHVNGDPLPLPEEKLNTSGVYRLVRHPLYLFSLMLIWPVMTMSEGYFGFCIGATIYLAVGSLYEERRMVGYFGEEYIQYRSRVPWMLPFPRYNMKL